MVRIKIKGIQENQDVELLVDENESLYKALVKASLCVEAPCGGRGTCGKCVVEVEGLGKVRSCKTMPFEGMRVILPQKGADNSGVLTKSRATSVELDPYVKAIELSLEKPSLSDQRSDLCRIEEASGARIEDIALLSRLTKALRERGFNITAVVSGNEIIDIRDNGDIYGVAVDIGTTTLAAKLVSLKSGEELSVKGEINLQRAYGADVITRIDATSTDEGKKALTNTVRYQIYSMIKALCNEKGVSLNDIYDVTCVGNTTMICMLLGLDTQNIAASPFIPPILRDVCVKSADLDMPLANGARLRTLPMISAYVGADTYGCMLACDMDKGGELSLMIDIGTNGELVLAGDGKIISCSTAAGPAFEGAHIEFGMGGVGGAIDKVKINEDGVSCTHLGREKPCGICGSGIVDAVSELIRIGVVDSTGRILDEDELPGIPAPIQNRITTYNSMAAFLLMSENEGAQRNIYVTQKDIREIQLAKSAIASGVMVMADEFGCNIGDIKRLYLAGGFGNFINVANACNIGLLPKVLEDVIIPVGNAALEGATMALLNKGAFNNGEVSPNVRYNVSYVELSARYDFQEYFIDNMEF